MVDERGQKNFCICKHRVYNHFYKGQIWTVPYISESLLTHCYALLLTRPIRSDVTILTSITNAMNYINNNYTAVRPLMINFILKPTFPWTSLKNDLLDWNSHNHESLPWGRVNYLKSIWSNLPRRQSQGFIMHSCPIPGHKGVLLVRQWQDGMV